MNKLLLKLFFIISLSFCLTVKANTLQYCIPVKEINLNPFREIKDGKELAYLLLLRPYISTRPEDLSIIEAYEFSPDGKKFTAKISSSAKWADGTPLSPEEAAMGIAKGFLYRPIGERVQVVGAKDLKKDNSISGIKIINDKTFEINFESTIENLTGAIREALTAGSRHNRVWPIRQNANNQIEVLAKNKFIFANNRMNLFIKNRNITLASSSECNNPDFSIYPEVLTANISNFIGKKNNNAQAITLQTNTNILDFKARQILATWIRGAFSKLSPNLGITSISSFFLEGEPGYANYSYWTPNRSDLQTLKKMNIKLGVEIPIFKTILEAAAASDQLSIHFFDFPIKDDSLHAQVLSSGIHNGRQIILQDILKWNKARFFLNKAPKTINSLEEIAKKSASTIPPDTQTLQNFEKIASSEYSLIPIGRRYVTAYSKKDLNIVLRWSFTGELIFE